MTRFKALKSCLIGLSLLAFGATAQAALVEITDLNASWINVDPASITPSGNGTDSASISWGTPAGGAGDSGYVFDVAPTPISRTLPPSPSSLFTLGTWTHRNNPITGTSLSTATLQLDARVEIDSVDQGIFSFLFDFTHNETTNNDNPCANGEPNGSGVNINGCADLVTVAFNLASDSISIGGDLFTLSIDPLSSTSFETIERADNSFDIQGFWALRSTLVPEPSALALLGIGLVGLGFARRNRKTA